MKPGDVLETEVQGIGVLRNRIGEVYREYFGKYFPAMTFIEVRGLYDQNAMIEIEGIAVIP